MRTPDTFPSSETTSRRAFLRDAGIVFAGIATSKVGWGQQNDLNRDIAEQVDARFPITEETMDAQCIRVQEIEAQILQAAANGNPTQAPSTYLDDKAKCEQMTDDYFAKWRYRDEMEEGKASNPRWYFNGALILGGIGTAVLAGTHRAGEILAKR